MTIPVWVLLAFAGWTLTVLVGSVGVYRWGRIFLRRSQIKDFRADQVEGSEWYKRAMRAHANCVENLPVYGAIVLAALVARVDTKILDVLAIVVISARIPHSLVHILFTQTNVVAAVRFSLFFVQFLCMAVMIGIVVSQAI